MATIIPFAPGPSTPVQFSATLDGAQYTVIVTWNLSGQRWYVNIYTLKGALVWTQAAVQSTAAAPTNLAPFTTASALVFYEASNAFVVTP